jgi:hypothetical protein
MVAHAGSHRPVTVWVLVAILLAIAVGGLATGPQLIADLTGAPRSAARVSLFAALGVLLLGLPWLPSVRRDLATG